ncbi:MAG: circadian clock protein KaiC [Methanosarcinaceae archaeon]|nr:circadian clock protein KaiC [Methanosarcinaceae archaeon]
MTEFKDLPCCIDGMDDILGNLKSPSVILIAGTAGVGKTTMTLQMLSNAAKRGEKTLYIPLTTETSDRLKMTLSTLDFLDESVEIRDFNRQIAEKDPLSTLIDIGNVMSSVNPDRLVIDPITPIGFGFVEQERRRFFYTLDSMVRESNSLVFLTGELLKEEIHQSVVSHLADGIIYLSKNDDGYHTYHQLEVLKMIGLKSPYSTECMTQKFNYTTSSNSFEVFPNIRPIDQVPEDKIIDSGIEGVNEMLNGGIPCGSSVLVAGGPGTGKAIFGWQFINEGLLEGENCIIITFNETPAQLIQHAKKLGWDLQKYVDDDKLHIIHHNPDERCFAEYAVNIKKLVENNQATRLLIDDLVNLEITLPDPQKRRGNIQSLTNYLKSSNVTSVFTTEVQSYDARSIMSKEASFIMDIIILLRQVETDDEIQKHLHILKSKGTTHHPFTKEYIIEDSGFEIK